MNRLMTQEESYAERRELFKNIWETSLRVDAQEHDVINKPKVIKTLRLDEVDKCVIGKRKKQRIKNLRTVCNKILDFCDRQDADDQFYEQMAAEGAVPLHDKIKVIPKKTTVRTSKMYKKAKSIPYSTNDSPNQERTMRCDKQDVYLAGVVNRTSRNTSPIKIKRPSLVNNSSVSKSVKVKQNGKLYTKHVSNHQVGDSLKTAIDPKKNYKKKRSNRRKIAQTICPPDTMEWPLE